MVCSPFISSSSPGHQMMGPPVATDNDVKMNIKAFKDKVSMIRHLFTDVTATLLLDGRCFSRGGEKRSDETTLKVFPAQVNHVTLIVASLLIILMCSIDREIPELVNSLSWVLDSPAKTVLFHYICRLLPEQAQVEFDRIAATMLAGGV